MKILFLTTGRFGNIEDHAIYPDLLRAVRDAGHYVYSVSSYEKKVGKKTEYKDENGTKALRVKIGNITKCGIIEKGISTLRIEGQYKRAIKKYFKGVKFDLVLYSTPPITLVNVIKYIKKRDGARSYLMLKDIFPQNAVDLGMMKKSGLKGLIYKFFRRKEKKLYEVSDYIGCMSQANVDYVKNNNPEVADEKLEICPNSVEICERDITEAERNSIREKYGLPLDKKIFVYGGNLGKPQGIPFLIECLKLQKNKDAFFLIVGDGTEYKRLEAYVDEYKPDNVKLLRRLPKDDYDKMIYACDVGMIFLDHRFTIPNFPSRLLAYMQAGLPVLATTDPNTDVGKVITEGGFGWWCESNDVSAFTELVEKALSADLATMTQLERNFLKENYTSKHACEIILKRMAD
ncbi:MAG: glycosyltransferase family 4 protein [Clostridia bacterium]|nr:glycosyltransferase family 4 protein [Clostridia bacterium]